MHRIAFVVHRMEPGGIERSITRIIGGLDQDLFVPHVICLDRSGPAAEWLPASVPVIEIKKKRGNDFRAVRRLSSTLRSLGIELVQSHNWGTLMETVVARKLAGVSKHVHAERGTVLGTIESTGFRYRARAIFMRFALATVDQVVSNANSVATRVQRACGYPVDRIDVIPNGVTGISGERRQASRQDVRETLGVDSDAFVIGAVGRLHSVKGFDVLIDAMQSVDYSSINAHLVVVGGGDLLSELQQLVANSTARDRVHLVGHQEDIPKWLLGMDLFVNSSRSEGMSQAIVEAMSAGLPIVATDVGDSKEMVSRAACECGLTCPAENAESLAKAINDLLCNPSLRDTFRDNAIQCHQQYFSETQFHRSMNTLYRQVLGV